MNLKSISFRIPHVFIFLFLIIILCSILSYFIPSGSFDREVRVINKIEQNVVVPGSYKEIPKHYSVQGVFIEDAKKGYSSPTSVLI